MINSIVIPNNERPLIRYQSSVYANCLKAWSVVREVWGPVCHISDGPSGTSCPKAIYHTVMEELAAQQKMNTATVAKHYSL